MIEIKTQSDAERRRATLKVHYALIFILIFGAILFGCPNDGTESQSSETTSSGSNKITSLQTVINSDEVQNGTKTEIDLSNYPDITDYNATINKSITIKDNKTKNLEGATLKVVTDGVTLSGIKSASVTTQSSLKISGSTLSSLKIETVSQPNASQISGRGTSATLSGRSSAELSGRTNPPTVEITDSSSVTNAVVSIENAQIIAETLTATEINLDSMNTQLTLKDNVSNISKIKTNKVCQVILEAGASSTIPTTKEKINVTGSGELTQIDMTVAADITLIALTPMSGLKSVVKKGGSIDFTDVVMLGTYTASSGIKVFRALSEDDYTTTFSKLEKNFTVKIGETKVFENGSAVNKSFWSTLETTPEGQDGHAATIELASPADNVKFEFNITVLPETITQIPEYVLSSIEVDDENAKTEYKDGDTLDLRRLIVWGTYTASDLLSYKGLVTDYTLDPSNGTVLTTANTSVSVSAGNCPSQSVPITVKPIWTVTIVKDASDDVNGTIVQKVVQGKKANKPNDPTKTGYTFQYWHKEGESTAFDFDNTPITAPVTLYAQWTVIQYNITYAGVDGATNPNTATKYTIEDEITLADAVKAGYTFAGWYNGSTVVNQIKDSTGDITLTAQWNIITYNITYDNTKDAVNTNATTYDIEHSVTLSPLSKIGWRFDGWFKVNGDTTADTSTDKWNENNNQTGDVSFYARWTPVWYITDDESKDLACGDTVYRFTSLVEVIKDNPVTITGSNSNWNNYLDSSAISRCKGAFIRNRTVKLSPYSIGKFEVTIQLYEAVMKTGMTDTQSINDMKYDIGYGDNYPAYFVSWYDAITFCNKLSLLRGKEPCYTVSGIDNWAELVYSSIPKEGDSSDILRIWNAVTCDITKNGYRLPTEAEWEFAARGGDTSKPDWRYAFSGIDVTGDNKIYDGSNYLSVDADLDTVGWYSDNGSSEVHPAGSRTANRLGIYDMSGNLYEWCWDWFGENITTGTIENPLGSDPGTLYRRVTRGGCWLYDAYKCCVSWRGHDDPYFRYHDYGFRLVCSGSGE